MKTLVTGNISSTVSMPIKSGTLIHLQDAFHEPLEALARSIIGPNYDDTKTYALEGCENIGSGSSANINGGWIMYNGTLYEVPQASFTIGAGEVIVLSVTDNYYTAAEADPVEFTDGSTHNVHRNRVLVASSGASGNGTVDYSNVIFINGISNLILGSNFTNYSAYGANVRALLKSDIVMLSGGVQVGSASINDIVAKLPVGYRPASARYVYAHINPFGTEMRTAVLKVDTNGEITVNSVDTTPWTAGTVLSLEGVSFIK